MQVFPTEGSAPELELKKMSKSCSYVVESLRATFAEWLLNVGRVPE